MPAEVLAIEAADDLLKRGQLPLHHLGLSRRLIVAQQVDGHNSQRKPCLTLLAHHMPHSEVEVCRNVSSGISREAHHPVPDNVEDRAAPVENWAVKKIDDGIFAPLLGSCWYRRACRTAEAGAGSAGTQD